MNQLTLTHTGESHFSKVNELFKALWSVDANTASDNPHAQKRVCPRETSIK